MGPTNHTRLLHTRLAAGLVPHEAPQADAYLHLRPAQRVPGGATVPSLRGRHQAQGVAAHLPKLAAAAACRQVRGRWEPKQHVFKVKTQNSRNVLRVRLHDNGAQSY